MEMQDSKLGKAAVVAIKGRIDNTSAALFQTHCETLIGKGERRLILDCEGLDYLSSAGLRCVLALEKKLKPQGGGVILCSLKPAVKEIFDISGFSAIFTVCSTIEDAAAKVL